MKTLCFCLLLMFSAPLYAQDAEETKQMYCWSYIKKLKTLYMDIKRYGTDQMIDKYPPQSEGVSLEYARKLGAEIEADENPSAWLKTKWDSCISNPQGAAK